MKWVSGSLLISRITAMMPVHFSVPPIIQPRSPSPDSLPVWGVPQGPSYTSLTCGLFCQAGLLGCEAVLSSMALMQANNIPGQKRMSSQLGQGHRASSEGHHTQHGHSHHGHQSHHGQPHHSHMGHASTGTCPPLVRSFGEDYWGESIDFWSQNDAKRVNTRIFECSGLVVFKYWLFWRSDNLLIYMLLIYISLQIKIVCTYYNLS